MYGNDIAVECETFWRDFGDKHESPEWRGYMDNHSALYAEKIKELTRPHVNGTEDDKRFGMSNAAGCTRAAALKFLGETPEPFSGSSLATFFIGHEVELMGIATLRSIGYRVEGQQEPVRIDPMMHSYSDGLMSLDRGNANGVVDTILSVKSIGNKKSGKERGKYVRRGFSELWFEGVRKAHPGWFAQAQAEMWGSNLDRTLVLAVCKDSLKSMEGDPYQKSGTFYTEMIEFDYDWCHDHLMPVWHDVWDNVQHGDPGPALYLSAVEPFYNELAPATSKHMPNAGVTGTFNPCMYCDMFAACERSLGRVPSVAIGSREQLEMIGA